MDTELPLRPSHHVQNMFTTIMQPIFTSRQMHIKIMCTSATECHFRRIATQIIFPSNEPCNSAASRNFDYIDGHQSCASNRNIIAVSIGPLLRFELASALKQKNKLPKIHDYVYALPRKKYGCKLHRTHTDTEFRLTCNKGITTNKHGLRALPACDVDRVLRVNKVPDAGGRLERSCLQQLRYRLFNKITTGLATTFIINSHKENARPGNRDE